MRTYILTVLTPDRPRIIQSITRTITKEQIGIVEMSQTVVRNYFTVTSVLELPETLEAATLSAKVQQDLGADTSVSLIEMQASTPPLQQSEIFILTLMGKNDPELLVAVSDTLANAGGNIVDFSAQSNADGMQVIAEVQLPVDCVVDQLQIDLQHASGSDELLQARLQHQRLFQATNEIAFRRIDHSK